MKRALALTLFTASLSVPVAWAADSPPARPAAKPATQSQSSADGWTPAQRAQMEKQIATMQEMHEKLLAAKTPEERAALMDEHMKSMQAGMSMMREMRGGPRGGMQMGMGRGPQMGMGPGQRCMDTCMQTRMDMMEMMMQMMMDRTGGAPARP